MDIMILALIGAAAGLVCMHVCRNLSTARGAGERELRIFSRRLLWAWCLAGAMGFALTAVYEMSFFSRINASAVFLLCFAIAAVDFSVKKIPNILLLLLMASHIAFLIYDFSLGKLLGSLAGLVVAAAVFAIPSAFKISVGAGDIKLAAVTGFCLGFYGFLQAMIIMAALISVFGTYLIIRKTGGFKTETAMGPYIAAGLFLTRLFPLI